MAKEWTRAAVFATIALGLTVAASGDPMNRADQTQQQLAEMARRLEAQEQRLDAQSAELAELRQARDQSWLNQRRAEEVRQLVRDVLHDADTRAALLDEDGVSGGHNGRNFYLSTNDGKFLLNIKGMVQFRYIFSTSDNAQDQSVDSDPVTAGVQPTDLDNDRGGFEMRRARFIFNGHIIDPSIQYLLLFQISRSDGDAVLLDAWAKKVYGNWSVAAGQFKVPLWREWLIVAREQPFVERSLLTSALAGSYTQGLAATYKADRFAVMLSLNDGERDLNGMWEKQDIEGVGVSGRADVLLAGDWKQHRKFTAWTGEGAFVAAGAAAHWQQGEYGTSGATVSTGDEAEVTRWSADLSAQFKGVSLLAAVIGNHVRDAQSLPSLDQYGVLVQGEYMIDDSIELMARYEWGTLDVPGVADLSILTVGFTKYWAKHNLKWTTDAGYAFNAVERVSVNGNTLGWADESTGWRPDADGAEGQVVVRSRIQLLF